MRGMKLGSVVLVLFAQLVCGAAQPPEGAIPARILRWHDGDTAQIRLTGDVPPGVGTHEVVRVLGIDTPEAGEPYAEDAARFFRTLTMGKTVYVELSPFERRDLHLRLLAHLWVETEEGWTLVSEAILRAGWARTLVFYPEQEKYYCRLLRACALAQRDKLGLWGRFREALSLEDIEADPVPYVTEVVTVVFTVARVGRDRWGLSLWAEGSRYGFRAVVDERTCPGVWEGVSLEAADLVGQTVAVSGALQWDSYGGGPRIVVGFPDQMRVIGEGSDP